MLVEVVRLRASPQGHLEPIPNVNVSGRPLPDAATKPDPSVVATIDRELPTRRLSDREVYEIDVMVSDAELAAHPGLALTVDFAPELFTLLNQSLIPIATPAPIDIAQAKKDNTKTVDGLKLYLEAKTYWGSPDVPADARRDVVFRFLDGGGQTIAKLSRFPTAEIRTPDLVLVGDDAPPQRLFICDVGENGPSLAEALAAARAAGVPVTVVPIDVNLGDSWLQDQFQIAAVATREAAQQVVVHLPRMVHDAALIPGTANLRNFTDAHFPSDGVGELKDFWAQKVAISDGRERHELGVAQSYILYRQLMRFPRLLQQLRRLLARIERAPAPPLVPQRGASGPVDDLTDLYQVRLVVDETAELLRVRTAATELQRQQIAAVPAAVAELGKVLGRNGDRVSFTVTAGDATKQFSFTAANGDALSDFFREVHRLHSPGNYGGNIEVSPPTGDSPDGKILTGTVPSDALKTFLAARAPRQPLAAANTEWLSVGHIDEIMSFVASAGRPQILRAAPEAALRLLQRAVDYQRDGVAVTRLFRGKKWIHEEEAGQLISHQPAGVHRWLVTPVDKLHPNDPHGPYDIAALIAPDLSGQGEYGAPAFHDDRRYLVYSRRRTVNARYAAFVTCADLISACSWTNHAVEALMLSDGYRYADELAWEDYYQSDAYKRDVLPYRLDTVLGSAFPDSPRIPMPTLFDRTDSFLNGGQTSALIPAAVNLQTLSRHVLVPRPYGPRMPVADAVRFIGELERRDGGLTGDKPNEQWIRQRGLDQTRHWTRASESVYRAAVGTRPTDFEPEYDEMWQSLMRAVTNATPTWDPPSLWEIQHANDPARNHPVNQPETLYEIAGYFKDGFPEFRNTPVDYCVGDTAGAHPRQDKYEADIEKVMDRIDHANPGAFDDDGSVISKEWTAIIIPEDTVDVLELQTQAMLESLGLQVHWVDSWYYHVHNGGIHCATNVLRAR